MNKKSFNKEKTKNLKKTGTIITKLTSGEYNKFVGQNSTEACLLRRNWRCYCKKQEIKSFHKRSIAHYWCGNQRGWHENEGNI